jgi:hypothetical protein
MVDPVDQPLAPSSPLPDPDDLEPKNHAATILSTEFFNTLSQIRTVVS